MTNTLHIANVNTGVLHSQADCAIGRTAIARPVVRTADETRIAKICDNCGDHRGKPVTRDNIIAAVEACRKAARRDRDFGRYLIERVNEDLAERR